MQTHFLPIVWLVFFFSRRLCSAATADDWRLRTIYQVFTDRFAVSNETEAQPCDPAKGQYCGGSWQGIIDKLDYIQDLGFSAVCLVFPAWLFSDICAASH